MRLRQIRLALATVLAVAAAAATYGLPLVLYLAAY
jgi:hypothetical protein